MVFHRLKYYSVVAILIIAIVLGVVFGGSVLSSNTNLKPEIPEISTPPNIDESLPNEDGSEVVIEEMPVFRDAYKLWQYSYNIFKNGKGYYGIMSGQADSQIGTQKLYTVLKRNGPAKNYSDNLEISYRLGDSSFLSSECLVTYTDKAGTQYRSRTKNYVFAESYVIENEINPSKYTDRFSIGERDVHDFLLEITSETTDLVYFDRTKKDYYEFKVNVHQDAVPANYYNPVLSSEYVDSIPQSSIYISITFKISKTNGHLLSYTLDESFEVVPSGILGIVGNQKALNYLTYTFYEMDKEQNIENPFV